MTAFIGTALLLVFWSAGIAAATYGRRFAARSFADDPLPARQALQAQLIGTALNRVMPAGTGLMTAHLRLLQRRGITMVGRTAAVAAYATGGAVAHVLLLGGALVAVTAGVVAVAAGTALSLPSAGWLLPLGAVAAAVTIVMLLPRGRRRAPRSWGSVRESAGRAWALMRSRPNDIAGLVLLQLLGQALLSAGLQAALFATGTTVSPVGVAVVSVLGASAAAALPAPGGSGPVEAGLVGGLMLLGVSLPASAAAVALFRGVTHWLPVPVGIAVALRARRRRAAQGQHALDVGGPTPT